MFKKKKKCQTKQIFYPLKPIFPSFNPSTHRVGRVMGHQPSSTSWHRALPSRGSKGSSTLCPWPIYSSPFSPLPTKRCNHLYSNIFNLHNCYYIADWNKCEKCDDEDCCCFCCYQACVLQRQRKGSVSSDASASTDSNTYYEDDFSSTEEDSSQGTLSFWI